MLLPPGGSSGLPDTKIRHENSQRDGGAVGSVVEASTSRWSSGHTKAQVVVAVGRVVPLAVARLAVPGVVVPATPAVHPVRAL